MGEIDSQFERRKKDHIVWSLDSSVQTELLSGLGEIELIHEALPEINFEEVSLETSFLSEPLSSPVFVSSMTAGHKGSHQINEALASFSERQKVLVGVGSQRKELTHPDASKEWKSIKKKYPRAMLAGNLGLTQLIQLPPAQLKDYAKRLVDLLEAPAFFVHTNPLQEVLQKEGTPSFKGGIKALEGLIGVLKIPVILKEVGCGFSASTLGRLNGIGLHAVDVSGLGGTHWGRIEGARFGRQESGYEVARTFENWGISTIDSMLASSELSLDYQVWASGGLRNGQDVAKMLCLGAKMVGMAQPWIKAIYAEPTSGGADSQRGIQINHELDLEKVGHNLDRLYEQICRELKISLFCTGCSNVTEVARKKVWKWRRSQMN